MAKGILKTKKVKAVESFALIFIIFFKIRLIKFILFFYVVYK